MTRGNVPSKLSVKLSGDGTNVARNLHVVNFTFTLLEEVELRSLPSGNHTLAIIKVHEKYELLSSALSDICKEIENLSVIEYDGHSIEIEYYLTGDWKFLALVTGLDAANAEHACIWCKCPKADRHKVSLEWSITDTTKGARTIEETLMYSSKPKSKQKYNCSRAPLFTSNPISRVVIDNLHLFLRIADVLINLLITALRRLDGIEQSVSKLDRKKQTHIAKYEAFLNEVCKIPFKFELSKDNAKKLQWRDLTGPEKLRLFTLVKIPDLFPDLPHKDRVQKLWMDFKVLYDKTSDAHTDPLSFKVEAKSWITMYLSVYQTKHVTPYIHAFVMHVWEFLQLYGSLEAFSQQALEKLNDLTTLRYLCSTNHKEQEALQQLLQKHNRLERMEDDGVKRRKRKCTCSTCGEIGHDKRACPTRD